MQTLNERCLRDGKIFEVRIDTFFSIDDTDFDALECLLKAKKFLSVISFATRPLSYQETFIGNY